MSSKYILYYSNTCEDCSILLQLLSKTEEINLAIDFICIDERIKDAQNSYYVVVGDDEIVPIPKIVTCVPSMIDVKNKNISIAGFYNIVKVLLPFNTQHKNIKALSDHGFTEIRNIPEKYKNPVKIHKPFNNTYSNYNDEMKMNTGGITNSELYTERILDNNHGTMDLYKQQKIQSVFHDDAPLTNTINQIERKYITKNICIDSFFRKNGTTSDFLYMFKTTLANVVSMELKYIEIPNLWYGISNAKSNNVFKITLYNLNSLFGNTTQSYTITIPDGNYTSSSFESCINNYFRSLGGGLNFVLFYINALTARCIFRAADADIDADNDYVEYPFDNSTTNQWYSPDFYFTLDFDMADITKPMTRSLGWYLGFRETSYTLTSEEQYLTYIDSVSAVTYKCYLTGESTYGNNVDNYFFVSVEDYNNNFSSNLIISENENSYLGSSILARIPIMVSSTEILTVNFTDNQSNKREYFGPVSIEKIRIKLIDRYGALMECNNTDWSICLIVKQLY